MLVELNLGLCDMLEISIFSCTHTHTPYPFDCDKILYEISSQALYHVLLPQQFATPEKLATSLLNEFRNV